MNRTLRPGLTLIELLVVIALITVLATLTVVYVVPAFSDNKNVLRGSDRVTSTLLIARQRALRDQAPRGVRFELDGDGFVRTLRYIEQPDDYRTGRVNIGGNITQATFVGSGVNLRGSADSGNFVDYAVQPGDWLRIGSDNNEIVSVDSPNIATLARTHTVPVMNQLYRIIRQPRPIAGEEPVLLPQNVGVNLGLMDTVGPNFQVPRRAMPSSSGPVTYFEILFDPAGGVINRATNTPIILWVQDITAEDPASNNTTRLIAIYPRTGLIAGHPVDRTPGNELSFALDGRSSGM